MTYFDALQPRTDAEHNSVQALIHDELVVQIAGHYIGADLCATPALRARIVSMAHPDTVGVATTALWVHTGVIAGPTVDRFDVLKNDSEILDRKQYTSSELRAFGDVHVTSPERTIVDLLLVDVASGLDGTLALLAHGADIAHARRRSYTLHGLHHLRTVRQVLDQLAATRDSPERFEPVTR